MLVEWHILYNDDWERKKERGREGMRKNPTTHSIKVHVHVPTATAHERETLCSLMYEIRVCPNVHVGCCVIAVHFHCCCHCFHLFYYVWHGFGMASLTVYMRDACIVYGWLVSVHATAVRAMCPHKIYRESRLATHNIKNCLIHKHAFSHSFFSSFRCRLFRIAFFIIIIYISILQYPGEAYVAIMSV